MAAFEFSSGEVEKLGMFSTAARALFVLELRQQDGTAGELNRWMQFCELAASLEVAKCGRPLWFGVFRLDEILRDLCHSTAGWFRIDFNMRHVLVTKVRSRVLSRHRRTLCLRLARARHG